MRRRLSAGSNVSISYDEGREVYRADYYFNVINGRFIKTVENVVRIPSERPKLGELSKSVAGAFTDYEGPVLMFFDAEMDLRLRAKFVNVVRSSNLPLEIEVRTYRKKN